MSVVLAKPNRLRRRAEFDRVFAESRAAHGKLVSVRMVPAKKLRSGFIVGKTVSGQAVVRNQVRRRLQAIVRDLAPRLDQGELVISAKPSAATADSKQLRQDLVTLLQKLGRLTVAELDS